MKRRTGIAVIALLVFVEFSAEASEPAKCLAYEPAEVTLAGRLVTRYFPGPPNYGETPRQDTKERVYLLQLQVPMCVVGNAASDLNSESEAGIVDVQLWPADGVSWTQLLALDGSKVILTGRLSHRITAHHRGPVLLAVSHFQRLAG